MSRKRKKMPDLHLKLGPDSVNLLLRMIAPWIESTEGIKDGKDMIYRLVLLELHRKIMQLTIDIEPDYDFTLSHYKAIALYQLLNDTDITDEQFNQYDYDLFEKMYATVTIGLNLPMLNLPTLQ